MTDSTRTPEAVPAPAPNPSPSGDSLFLEIEELYKAFPVPRSLFDKLRRRPIQAVRALNGVSLYVNRGETLGIVGESGCGKSTLARCIVRLHDADSGEISFDDLDVLALSRSSLRAYNRRVQMVFQDPFTSLNPRMTVGEALSEAVRVHKLRPPAEVNDRVNELLDLVGLPLDTSDRLPHEFSGGQRQRIAIARSLALEPECLVADELVSALDVSVQAQIINLLLELQAKLHLTVLFVAHDLRLVRHISHRVAVMYLGRVVELADTETVFTDPKHPYTRALISAAPTLNPTHKSTVEAIQGELPSPLNVPSGCPFHPRCPMAFDRCRVDVPALKEYERGHMTACHLYEPDAPAVLDAKSPFGVPPAAEE